MKIGAYDVHPAALEWPALSPADLDALTESIRAVGQRETVKLLDGAIVDGVHRARACEAAGVAVKVTDLPADTDPWEYSATVNGRRRHLESAGKRAAIVRALLEHSDAWQKLRDEADERKAKGVAEPSGNVARTPPRPRDALAKKAGVSARTAQDVITVREKDPELFERVKRGEVSASAAAKQVRNPKPVPAPDPGLPTADALDREIPPDMREAWHRMQVLCASFDGVWRDLARDWRKAKAELEAFNESAKSPALARYLKDLESAIAGPLKAATYAIRSTAPYVVCWKCDGAGCAHCQKAGLYTLASKVNVERELGKAS